MAIGNPISLTSNVATKTINVIATASQTSFTVTGGYRINELSVFRNGVRLVNGRDFTARDGSIVTLLSAASEGDVLEFQVFDTFRVADAITPFDSAQTIAGDLSIVGVLSATQLGSVNFNLTSGIQTFHDVRVGGALTVAGTLTYEDTTNTTNTGLSTFSGGMNISGVGATVTTLNVTGISTFSGGMNISGISTFSGGMNISGVGATVTTLNVTGVSTFSGAISVGDTVSLGDHDRLRFGAGNDLQIYHSGFNRIASTGALTIDSDDDINLDVGTDVGDTVNIRGGSGGSETLAIFAVNGSVDLYYDNSKKFETTSSGAKVSGSFPDFIIHDTDTTNDNFRILHNGGGTQLLVDPNNVGPNASYLIVGIDGTERLRVDNNGLVGINTTAPESQLTVKGDGVIGAKAFKYNYTTDHGIQVKGNESAIDIVATDGGNHGSSLLLRSSLDGFGMFFDPTRDQLRFMYTVPSADNFSIHDGGNTSTNTEALIIGKTGICTATQLFEGTTRVATGGKAIAMALIFG